MSSAVLLIYYTYKKKKNLCVILLLLYNVLRYNSQNGSHLGRLQELIVVDPD